MTVLYHTSRQREFSEFVMPVRYYFVKITSVRTVPLSTCSDGTVHRATIIIECMSGFASTMRDMFRQSLLLVACATLVLPGLAVPSDWPYLQVYPPVNETDDRTPLYIATTLSFGGSYRSVGALPGVQIALDYINSNRSLLPGYTLHYTLTDSQVHSYAKGSG